MSTTIHLVMGDIASDDDKWQKAFKNYLSYALNQQQNIKAQWTDTPDLLENTLSDDHPVFILGAFSNHNMQNQGWSDCITQLWKWSKDNDHGYFYKVLREPIDTTKVPSGSSSVRKFDLFAYDPKSGELIPESTLLSEKINLFLPKVFLLTKEIASQTKAFYNAQLLPETKKASTKKSSKNTVFLAQVSPQSAPLREKLKQELISQGFQVLPSTTYSFQDEEALHQAIQKDLKKSSLVIHLFGEEVDTRRDGINNTIEAIQNKAATKYFQELLEDDQKIVKRMIWIADMARIKNQQY